MFRRTLTDTDANTRHHAGATTRNPAQRKRRLFRERLYFLIAVTTRNPNLIPKIGVFLYGDRIVRNSKILAGPLHININSVDRNFRDRGFKKEGRLPIDAICHYGLPDPKGWYIYRDLKAGGEWGNAKMAIVKKDTLKTAAKMEDTKKEPKSDNDLINEEDQNSLIEDFEIDFDDFCNLRQEEFCYPNEVYDDDYLFAES